jgi:HAD superfamily hydrolase (TIGR01509 family)
MKDYDAYLFDWDGTIASSLAVWLSIVKNEILQPYGIVAHDKTIVRTVFGRAAAGLVELGVPESDLGTVFQNMDVAATTQLPLVPLYDGIRELLDRLSSKGKKLAVITATVRPTMTTVLKNCGLEDIFDITVTGDEVRAHKPDPEGILYVLDHLGIKQERAVMLGDSEKDIGAAHNAGIDSILFYPPQHEAFHTLKELTSYGPTQTIHSWRELIGQLQ